MAFKTKKSVKSLGINKNIRLTRKQQRKQKRKEKKMRRNEFYMNKKNPGRFLSPSKLEDSLDGVNQNVLSAAKAKKTENKGVRDNQFNKILTTEQLRKKEKREQTRIQKEMMKQRTKQLLKANIEEDRNIKQLEKQLKLNKRKTKSIPKSFANDGLDYLLEVCDSETMQSAVATEQDFNEVNDEFEEDFALMAGKASERKNKADSSDEENENSDSDKIDELEGSDFEEMAELGSESGEESGSDKNDDEGSNFGEMSELDSESGEESRSDRIDDDLFENDDYSNLELTQSMQKIKNGTSGENNKVEYSHKTKSKKTLHSAEKNLHDLETENPGKINSDMEEEISVKESRNAKRKKRKEDTTQKFKKSKHTIHSDDSEITNGLEENLEDDEESETKGVVKKHADGTWEDIYGRLRAKDGTVINKNEEKYIPPAVRAKLETGTEDKKRLEKLSRLKKQLKGLLNRLAESNMHSIASQIEDLYMNNSRNDMNDTLTNLIMESLISTVITPERLLVEHVVLIAVLHANIGTEVGAHFLQTVIKKFDEYISADHDVENKMMDNTVNIIAQLYNFKLFDSKLLYEILRELSKKFGEKDIECILHILKNVGFTLRKDDPLALKNLILDLQKQAANASEAVKDNPRVKFMLDVLLAIKNNNVSKIPNYDTSYPDHLKKVMKGFIRKGNYITLLNISLEDLLKADERGKWWVVGSAWTGSAPENNDRSKKSNKTEGFSEKLLELAAKQRMNTDVRRNIFCIIMSAEDYLDAFEKLLRLGLKNQQEREIINVLLHCCLHEKVFNPYYAVLAQKFCEYDRKYQMTIKYSVWDKLKTLTDHSGQQISNLAKMLTHLFIEKGLPISTLKIVQFGELDKVTLRFMRQILLGILLYKETESCIAVFEKVSQSDKLKLFRESLRLFIHHFLLRNLKSETIPEEQKSLLETRAKLVEKVLISKEGKLKF